MRLLFFIWMLSCWWVMIVSNCVVVVNLLVFLRIVSVLVGIVWVCEEWFVVRIIVGCFCGGCVVLEFVLVFWWVCCEYVLGWFFCWLYWCLVYCWFCWWCVYVWWLIGCVVFCVCVLEWWLIFFCVGCWWLF